jgi:hypothetical protein
MTLEHEYRSLLKYLGIHPELVVTSPRIGHPRRELHLHCDDERISDVLSWTVKRDRPLSVRVFEGDPPPF